jgi:hypothetical protein
VAVGARWAAAFFFWPSFSFIENEAGLRGRRKWQKMKLLTLGEKRKSVKMEQLQLGERETKIASIRFFFFLKKKKNQIKSTVLNYPLDL